jgi:hypothetical protein
MIGGAVSAMGGVWHAELLWLALPASLGPTAVLLGKHIDKIEKDTAKGTLTVITTKCHIDSLKLCRRVDIARDIRIQFVTQSSYFDDDRTVRCGVRADLARLLSLVDIGYRV